MCFIIHHTYTHTHTLFMASELGLSAMNILTLFGRLNHITTLPQEPAGLTMPQNQKQCGSFKQAPVGIYVYKNFFKWGKPS